VRQPFSSGKRFRVLAEPSGDLLHANFTTSVLQSEPLKFAIACHELPVILDEEKSCGGDRCPFVAIEKKSG